MSSLREQPPSVAERVVRSPWPQPDVPAVDLTSFVLRHAGRLAGRPAVIDGASGRTVTYGELAVGVERVAAGLAARGFGRGDVLALHLPNIPEFPMILHGGLRAGGSVSPASPLFTAAELARQLRSTGAGLLITVGPLAGVAREAAAQAGVDDVIVVGEPSFGELMGTGGAPRESRPEPQELAVMLSSSGTTGLPKAVQLTHAALVANLVQMAAPFPIEEGERVLGLAPFFHSMGLSCVLNHALANGGTVVALARLDLEVMLQAMETHGVQQALAAPPLLAALAHHPRVSSFDLSALRTVGSGGAPAGAALEQAVAERLDCLVGQGYGMTEASTLVAVCPLGDPSLLRPGSVGLLVGGTEARVVDPRSGATLPAGEDGELWVRGPQLMAGYRDDPEATAAAIDDDGWLHTGDLGHIDEDGSIFLVDRLKELIKVRGFQVAPAELEAVLVTHPAVADAAVIGVPDERDGERPKAFVVSRGPLDREELSAYVAERVAPYKRLGAIEEIDELPKSLTGKLLRRVLVERERQAVRECAPKQTTTMARAKRAGRTYAPWGMLAAIDLHGGDRTRLADPDSIRRFVPALIAAIGMRAHGALMIDRFGDDELEGWSAMQFIETSSITIHADEVFGRCFIDVFSCRPFDPDVAGAIAVAHFGGTPTVTVLER
jgi:acyl-CoA synthetase (AMP-forming)/AMP-acid ligase II/S-adenosylmethionine/arginine decarboxylase-like enzyme